MRVPLRILVVVGLGLSLSSAWAATNVNSSGKKGRVRASSKNSASQAVPGQSSTLLPDGRVLLLGGEGPSGPLATAAVQDPQSGATTPLGVQLPEPRAWHTASLLPDGTVLIFGGIGGGGIEGGGTTLDAADLFDPATRTFQALPSIGLLPRAHHTATLLTNGLIFVAGGVFEKDRLSGTAQLWDFRANTTIDVPQPLLIPRQDHSARLLPDGTVLLWGGIQANGQPIADGEVFDPASSSFRIQSAAPPRRPVVAPQAEATVPENNADSVPGNALITIRFSEPLNVRTANSGSITLSASDGAVSAKVIPAEGGILAFVMPAAPLLSATNYTVTAGGLSTQSGAPVAAVSFSFTTDGSRSGGETGILGTAQSPTTDPTDSPFKKLPPLQAPPGVTAISGQVLLLDGMPAEGVTLRVGKTQTETDRTGRFLLRNISSSHVAMVIDGRTASTKHVSYGVFEDGVDVTPTQTNILKYTIWMPEIDTRNAVPLSVPTSEEVVVTTPRIPGLELHIPAGTTVTDIDGHTAQQVSITPIPVSQPPFPLPPGVNVPVYFTVQPGGGYLTVSRSEGPQGAWLVYPNSFHQTAGSGFDFWNYDADDRGWFIYGHGKVAPDAKNILPDPGVVIYELTGAMVGGSGQGASTGPSRWCESVALFCDGDPVDIGTGLFVFKKTDLYLPDILPIQLIRSYRPNDAASRAFGVGTSHNYDIFLVGTVFPYTYMDLVFADGSRIECPRTSTGTSYADAIYGCASMPGTFFGANIAWNGNGWTLTRRDGVSYKFPDGFNSSRAQQNGLLSITDRNGNTMSIARDSNSNITQITSPMGRSIQFTYDTNFRVSQIQDNIGRIVQYSYDAGGRLTQVIDLNNGIWKYSYDSSNNMTSLIDPRNITYLQNQYDSQNRVTKQTVADGLSTYQFTYNPSACTTNCTGIWETDVTDPNGNIKKVLFNSAPVFINGFASAGPGSSAALATGTGLTESYSYQYQPGANFVTSVTDPLNRLTSYTYDTLGNATSVTRLAGTPNAVTGSMTYEAKFSRVTSVTDPLNHTTTNTYDTNGNLISTTDPLGNTTTRSYNSVGQMVSESDPLGQTVTFTYDGSDLVGVTDPLGRSTTFFADSVGRRVSQTDPLGYLTKYTYNSLNEVTQVVDPSGAGTLMSYDASGNLASVTDARNTSAPTTYTYDNFNRIATRTDPLGNQASYQYDANNNLSQFTDRRGKIAVFTYDSLNRRIFTGFGKSGSTYESSISYTFDAGNRLTQAVDSISGTVTRGYDGLDHLISETTANGTSNYTYDNACRRTSFTPPGQPIVNYSYDNANRLMLISQSATTVSLQYDGASRRTALTLPNGIMTTYTYDSASDLTGLTYTSNSTVLGTLSYVYDLGGRRTGITGSYARTNLPLAVTTTAYNAANQLSTWGTANLFYDANGNMTSDGTHSYAWDARNHLTAVDGGNTATFSYDAFGRRVSKAVLGTSTTFGFDGSNAVQESIAGSNNATSLMGGIDEVFQRTDSAGARSFLADALGNTLAQTDSAGAIQTAYTFEPFGRTTVTGSSSTNSFAYTGRELDTTGLYFYRARYYSPVFQRFLSEDPAGFQGGINTFSYVSNNPVRYVDPSGLNQSDPGGAQPCTINGEPGFCATRTSPPDWGWGDPPAPGGGGVGTAGFGGIPPGTTFRNVRCQCWGDSVWPNSSQQFGCLYLCACGNGEILFAFRPPVSALLYPTCAKWNCPRHATITHVPGLGLDWGNVIDADPPGFCPSND
jgi:RHS repeat-associated protein